MSDALDEYKATMKAGVVFDWHLAAELIGGYNRFGLDTAYARLPGVGRVLIWKDGKSAAQEPFSFTGHNCFELLIGEGDSHGDRPIYNCYCPQSDHTDWNADTYWPESALVILAAQSKGTP